MLSWSRWQRSSIPLEKAKAGYFPSYKYLPSHPSVPFCPGWAAALVPRDSGAGLEHTRLSSGDDSAAPAYGCI